MACEILARVSAECARLLYWFISITSFDGRAVGGTIPPPLKPWSRPVGASHGMRFRLANCRDFQEPLSVLAIGLNAFGDTGPLVHLVFQCVGSVHPSFSLTLALQVGAE